MAVNANTILEKGDIVEADSSWFIYFFKNPDDHSNLVIGQKLINVYDTTQPRQYIDPTPYGTSFHTYYPRETFVNMEGPPASETCSYKIDDETSMTVVEICAKEGISVRGKNFVVTAVEPIENNDRHSISARESDSAGNIKPQGLTVTFKQYAYPHENVENADGPHDDIHEVKVIGKVKVAKP